MGLVFRPQARRAVPAGRVQIDWSHPLANGLIGCWLPGVCNQNLASTSPDQVPQSAFAFNLNQEGPSISGQAINTGTSSLAPSLFKTWTGFSAYWRGYMGAGATGTTCPLFGVEDLGASFTYLCLMSKVAGSPDIQIQSSAGNTATDFIPSSGIHSCGMVAISGSTVSLYGDGVLVGSAAAYSTTPSFASTTRISINLRGDTTAGTGCDPNVIHAYNRALSAAEMAALDAEPYGFLSPAEGEMPTLFVAAAGGFIAAWARNSNLPVIGTGTY